MNQCKNVSENVRKKVTTFCRQINEENRDLKRRKMAKCEEIEETEKKNPIEDYDKW